jgi:hypothetical protein
MVQKRELPGFYPKRKLLFGAKTSRERLREMGEAFMDAGRYDDALEFFGQCGAEQPARKIAELAMQAGNVPLYMRAKRVLAEQISEEEWTQIAAHAERAGAFSMAYVAHSKAGHEEEAARVRRLVPGMEAEEEAQGQRPPEGKAAE